MKLLILTQKVDVTDPILGFFHRWIEEFAKRYESLVVVCLEKGEYHLPQNVKVLSLGKEEGRSKLTYILRFYNYIFLERGNYDAVFVHMNQEYALLAGLIWKILGKKVYMWRNHSKGSLLTRIAVILSTKVFYTSPNSYTAKFRNAVQMPVGVDTDYFKPDPNVIKEPNSVLFLGRISPIKKVLEFISWAKENDCNATIAGPILPQDMAYGELVKHNLTDKIKFIGPVNQEQALKLYQSHDIYVNMTPAGSMDKTIFEAAACGMKLDVDNPDVKIIEIEKNSLQTLMSKLEKSII